MAKDKEYNQLIHSSAWQRTRREKLMSQPLCEMCSGKDVRLFTPATCVHHITPVETGITMNDKKRLMFSMENLMSLCDSCHHEIHKQLGSYSSKEMRQRKHEIEMEKVKKMFGG